MDRVDVADGPIPDPFAERANRIERVALVAQLRHDLVLLGRLHQGADLADGVGQGLLAVDVLAPLDGRHRRHGVGVVGRADDHRVDLLVHLVEHLAEVLVHLGVRELRNRRALAMLRPQIDVAEGHDVGALGDLVDVVTASPAGADRGDVQFLAGRRLSLAPQHVPRHNRKGRHGPRRFQKLLVVMFVRLVGSCSHLKK